MSLPILINDLGLLYEWVKGELSTIEPPLVTCEGVLSEAFFLLRRNCRGQRGLFNLIKIGVIRIDFCCQEEIDQIERMMNT